ncbi:hypothetical protein QBC47DRAFT_458221 [Echria macrotheca]|uniref:Uncharacterized protein n=1 Tax=Echria macrotheca TaxID=438768 RepID=A0AAJ0FDU1_9PEZI|nr:hypothetical protein QBC47DRAFT_458221 [Echria macrotheca]
MKSLACLPLLFTSALAAAVAVVQRSPSPLNPNGPSTPPCPAPRVLCDDICCQANYICSSTSFTCVKKPPPPPPGNLTISWMTDRAGNPNIIVLHGRGFSQGAAVGITENWIQWEGTNNDIPGYASLTTWSHDFAGLVDFDYSTGIQDCGRAGSPGAGTFGEPADLHVLDWALMKTVVDIQVRAQFGGLCKSVGA